MVKKMDKRKFTMVISILSVLIFVVVIVTASYAFYTTTVKQEGNPEIKGGTATLGSSFIDGPTIQKMNIIPGDTITKTFKIMNNGGNDLNYKIVINELQNEFTKPEDLQYTLKNGEDVVASGSFPTQTGAITEVITIATNETHNYTFTITYLNTTEDQSADMGKSISGKIFIEEV